MDVNLILIDDDTELTRARALSSRSRPNGFIEF
jgi:hypothetical protein